jgi:hypothetical protein
VCIGWLIGGQAGLHSIQHATNDVQRTAWQRRIGNRRSDRRFMRALDCVHLVEFSPAMRRLQASRHPQGAQFAMN